MDWSGQAQPAIPEQSKIVLTEQTTMQMCGVWDALEAYGKVSRPWPGPLRYFCNDYTFHPDMAKVTAQWPLASLFAQGGAIIWQCEQGSTEVIVYSFLPQRGNSGSNRRAGSLWDRQLAAVLEHL